MRFSLIFLAFLLTAGSCKRSEKFSEIPAISVVSVQPNIVPAGSSEVTVFITLKITDGDADLGKVAGIDDVFLLDSRAADTFNIQIEDTLKFTFPEIPKNAITPDKGLEGYCIVRVDAARLLFRDTVSTREADTVSFRMYVYDKKRHKSNEVTTPEIYLTK